MKAPAQKSCSLCERYRQENGALQARVGELEAQLAVAKKNSSNSSKPPSSDIIKPPKPAPPKGKKRKRGGQSGHPRHERKPFPPEQVDLLVNHTLAACPDCGGRVALLQEAPRVLQQIEMPAAPMVVTEHHGLAYFCKRCQKTHYAPLAPEVRQAGLLGPRLTAIVAFLKGGCHCSFSTVRKFLRDVVGVTVSRAHLRNVCAEVSDSLDDAYAALLAALPTQAVINVDETGHKEYRRAMWTWCFRTATFTWFKIDPRRSSAVLVEALGEEFRGVLGCDYFSAYRKYMGDFDVLVQFCLAHLLRDMRFLAEHPDRRNHAYAARLIEATREMFHVIHDREQYSARSFHIALQDAGDELEAQALYRVPNTQEARNLARRFQKHGASYLRFITMPGIEPTNNLVEQAIRFVVIDRLVTQGSRCEAGRRWLERIWTVMATCAQQGKSAFEFLAETIAAHFKGAPTPSLAPNTS